MKFQGGIMPKVFISYSWEDEEHKEWVRNLANQLLSSGIDTKLDQYDLLAGDRLPQFMEESIDASDYVIIICTPKYKEKLDNRSGGVGYEGNIISGELLVKNNERKYIPVISKGNVNTAIPNCIKGKLAIDLSSDLLYEQNIKELISTIWGGKVKPEIGTKPEFVKNANPYINKPEEPIHIIGIITEEVTSPRNDGTPGCALYRVPFRLSKNPSEIWIKIFISEWNDPPSYTTMHRPGIASVYGDRIILDGTTIEEVKDYHKKTLELCVDVANEKERQYNEKRKRIEQIKKEEAERHYNNVLKVAEEINFFDI